MMTTLKISLEWSEDEGKAVLDSPSKEALASEFNHSSITLLDFLFDSIALLIIEYEGALTAHNQPRASRS
jgi:hypothetical protein